jgi:hypothetical protein
MKICFKCNINKPLGDYYKHAQTKDGHLNKCKECTKKDVSASEADYGSTEKGVVRVIYKTQKRNSKLRGHGEMPYTKKQLKDWLYSWGFKSLYDDWVKSGLMKDLKPSVDRIDDFKGYSFENIRLGTWKDNREHQYSDIRKGTGTGGLRCKALSKIDIDGKTVCTYVSYSSASRDMGYSLEHQIKSGSKCRSGFYWKYDLSN